MPTLAHRNRRRLTSATKSTGLREIPQKPLRPSLCLKALLTPAATPRQDERVAFFFASLDQEANLGTSLIVIDDPASSLDDGRTIATAQEIRSLSGRVQQLIVLSHSKQLLCSVWDHADKQKGTSPIISDQDFKELDSLREYANRFHHDTNPPSWDTEIANINETQLLGFAKRVLAFTKK